MFGFHETVWIPHLFLGVTELAAAFVTKTVPQDVDLGGKRGSGPVAGLLQFRGSEGLKEADGSTERLSRQVRKHGSRFLAYMRAHTQTRREPKSQDIRRVTLQRTLM